MSHVTLRTSKDYFSTKMNTFELASRAPDIGPLSIERHVVFDESELVIKPDELSRLVSHTMSVFSEVETLRRSAVQMCISLRECKNTYVTAIRNAYPDRKNTGWEAFCKTNFESLGLSQGHIRTAVQTGEMLIKLKESDPKGFDALSKLSRAALFAVSAAPETVHSIKSIIEESPESSVTTQQVNQLRDALRTSNQESEELKNRLSSALQAKSMAEEVVNDLNNRCQAHETLIGELKSQSKTQVKPPEQNLPPAVMHESESLDELKRQSSDISQEISQKNAEVSAVEKRLTDVQRKLNEQTEVLDLIAGLNKDIGEMTQKYSQALIIKIKQTNPKMKEKLFETAELLRKMAEQLSIS